MNKLAVVLGVAAVATLAGCKDPEYARNRIDTQDEVKSIDTDSSADVISNANGAAGAAESTVIATDDGEITVVATGDGDAVGSCQCASGTHDSGDPCACGSADCACPGGKDGVAAGKVGAESGKSGKSGKVGAAGVAAGAACAAAGESPVCGDAGYTVYIVQKGDYLAKISKKYNIKIDAIKSLNNMTSDNIRLGQKIKLPGKIDVGVQEVPAGAIKATPKKVYESYTGATKDYVVVAGDTLGGIAYSNGMNIRQLKELNGLKSDLIKVGQKLKVADGHSVAKPVAAKVESKPVAAKVESKPVAAKAAAPKVETKVVEAVAPKAEPAVAETASKVDPVVEAVSEVADGTTNYVVQEGDDLPTIAIEFRVPVARLRELNNLGEGDEVKPGQVLKIPAEM